MRLLLISSICLLFLTPKAWAFRFDARVETYKFRESHEKKISEALELIVTIVKSDSFVDRLVAFTHDGKPEYVQNNGLSNFQIYLHILQGTEELIKVIDAGIDIELELWIPRFPTSTTGYTSPSVNRIWIKKSYLERATVAQVAGTIFHEWLHKIGFKHDKKPTARRPYSVPYALGELLEELAMNITNEAKFHARIQCFEKLSENELNERLKE